MAVAVTLGLAGTFAFWPDKPPAVQVSVGGDTGDTPQSSAAVPPVTEESSTSSTASTSTTLRRLLPSSTTSTTAPVPPTPLGTLPPIIPREYPGSGPPVIQFGLHEVDRVGLYAVNADGTDLRRLAEYTSSPPVFSPNGQWLATSTYGAILVLDPHTGARRKHPEVPEVGDLTWSPDSTRLAYVGEGEYSYNHVDTGHGQILEERIPHRDLYVTQADGGSPPVRLRTARDELAVTWISDGQLAALDTEGIWTFRPDGSDARLLYALPFGRPLPWTGSPHLHLSPDGRHLAVVLDGRENLIVNMGDGQAVVVDDEDDHSRGSKSISWAPSSMEFVYARTFDGHPGAFIAPLDGSPDRLLDPWLGRPVWSARGDLITGMDNPAGGLYRQVVTVRPDGTGRRTLLTVSERFAVDPWIPMSWSPDGGIIAFGVTSSYGQHEPPGAVPH